MTGMSIQGLPAENLLHGFVLHISVYGKRQVFPAPRLYQKPVPVSGITGAGYFVIFRNSGYATSFFAFLLLLTAAICKLTEKEKLMFLLKIEEHGTIIDG